MNSQSRSWAEIWTRDLAQHKAEASPNIQREIWPVFFFYCAVFISFSEKKERKKEQKETKRSTNAVSQHTYHKCPPLDNPDQTPHIKCAGRISNLACRAHCLWEEAVSALRVSALRWKIIVFVSQEAQANTRNNLVTTQGTIGSMQIDSEANYKHSRYFHTCSFYSVFILRRKIENSGIPAVYKRNQTYP